MEEAGGRECEESRVKDRGSWRSNEMKGRCESNRVGDEVYPATFGNGQKTGLKLDRRRSYTVLHKNSDANAGSVGVYVSDFFQFQELTFNAFFSGCESLWITLSRPNTEIDYAIGTICRHPKTNANAFCDYI